MKRLILLTALLICLASFGVNAQMDFKSKFGMQNLPSLKVGDQIPDIVIPKVFNFNKKNLIMADFQDQLLILDFWATWCGGCVKGLPKMEKLQKEFGDKVMMLPVTYESEKVASEFWKSNIYTKNLTIPSIVEDKILLSYFPHKAVPNEVWIYKGKVIAITEADYVNAEHIKMVLSGANINWPVKNDFYTVFNGNLHPLFQLDSNQINVNHSFVKYAAISDFKKNIGPAFLNSGKVLDGIARDSVNKTIRTYFVNQPIYEAYYANWILNGGTKNLVKPVAEGPHNVVWEVVNKYKYIQDPKSTFEEWISKNGICFESLNPDSGQTDQKVYESINQDMDRLLGLHVRWEKRKEKVLVLIRTSKLDKIKSKHIIIGDAHGYLTEDRHVQTGTLHKFRDWPLPNLVGMLNIEESNPYVFDETGYNGNVDMDLDIPSWSNVSAVRKAIKPYDLDLKEEERFVDKFVFSEVNGGLLVDAEMQIKAKARRNAQKNMLNPSIMESKSIFELNKRKSGIITLPSGLQYKIIRKGEGKKPRANDKVIINYTAMLANGKIFESSYENGRPSDPLNVSDDWGGVLKGLNTSLKMMPVGSKWIIYIPSELAFGIHTNSGRIPPNSAVIYEVELLNILD